MKIRFNDAVLFLIAAGESFKLESPYGDELPNKVNIFKVSITPSVS